MQVKFREKELAFGDYIFLIKLLANKLTESLIFRTSELSQFIEIDKDKKNSYQILKDSKLFNLKEEDLLVLFKKSLLTAPFSAEEYDLVLSYFIGEDGHPFSMLETFKKMSLSEQIELVYEHVPKFFLKIWNKKIDFAVPDKYYVQIEMEDKKNLDSEKKLGLWYSLQLIEYAELEANNR
jgi:hypothetical protein